MKTIARQLALISFIGLIACSSHLTPDKFPDANNLSCPERMWFEREAAGSPLIFVGTLTAVDTRWNGYSGVGVACSSATFHVERVVFGQQPTGEITLDNYMVGAEAPWVEERAGHTGLRLSRRFFHVGAQYIVLADRLSRFCGKDSINSIWLKTPSNLQAVLDALPVPLTNKMDAPSVSSREPMNTWWWRYDPRRFSGSLGLRLVVTQSGYVGRVEISDPVFPDMDRDIADWVRWKWRFTPARRGGSTIPVELALSIRVKDGIPEGMQ